MIVWLFCLCFFLFSTIVPSPFSPLQFFNQIGEVKFVRMAGEETQPTRFAFVEFSDVGAVAQALTYNGVMFFNRPLKIHHSNNAIVKPQSKSSEAAQREIEEAMKKVNR